VLDPAAADPTAAVSSSFAASEPSLESGHRPGAGLAIVLTGSPVVYEHLVTTGAACSWQGDFPSGRGEILNGLGRALKTISEAESRRPCGSGSAACALTLG